MEIDEGHALLGETPYAKSKIMAEDIITAWCREHHVRLTILRLPLVVGESPPGNLGSMISMMKKGLYFGIGSGASRKSMVLAEDVARFIPAVALIGGVYNLTDGYHPSMLELELAIASRLNKSAPRRLPDFILRMAARLGDLLPDGFPINSSKFEKLTSTLIFSDVKARTQAGWNPRRVINYLPKAL